MKHLARKIVLSLISLILLLTSISVPVAHAADSQPGTWYNQGFVEWYTKVYDENISPPTEIFGERYTAAQVQWILWSLISFPLNYLGRDNQEAIGCLLKYIGQNVIDAGECKDAVIGLFKRHIDFITPTLATTNVKGNAFALMFDTSNRPISGIAYTKNLINKFSPVKDVSAQTGFGYTALNPIQKYWSGIRDISYVIVVLLVIVFSFMIMFRVKISPQVVISVQSALPKVFTAVILATFSYAIAGFLIDLMYVFGGVLALFLNLAGFKSSFEGAYLSIFPVDTTGLYVLVMMFFYTVFFLIGVILSFIVAAINVFAVLPAIAFGAIGIFLVIWLLLLTIWYTFKIPWVLIKNLIIVYFSIIIAPLQIIIGAFAPQIGFGAWLKRLISALMVFPVTGLFMCLAWLLMWTAYKFIFEVLLKKNILSEVIKEIMKLLEFSTSFQAPVVWVPEIIGFAEACAGFIILIMSFGIIVAIPKVTEIIKSFIMGEKFEYGTAIGEAVGVPRTAGTLSAQYLKGVEDRIIRPNLFVEKLAHKLKWLSFLPPSKG